MNPSTPRLRIVGAAAAAALLSAVVAVPLRPAASQQPAATDHATPGHRQMPGMMQQHGDPMTPMHGHGSARTGIPVPAMPGQDAFGAIQEIVRILEADPKTDWSKIDLEALRQHLIDMNEVTLKADVAAKPIDGGLEIAVTGAGRTLAGIRRMVTAHARELDRIDGWSARTAPLPDGVLLTVTSGDPKEVRHIRGLGFVGLLVTGAHHQPHHLAMARGELAHRH
ncbi:MAG: hypothetical protein IT561_24770 [Alphaproteobacteria bacterium]|nr:hypothetical protein [Alphaproteobacteria bacterium]